MDECVAVAVAVAVAEAVTVTEAVAEADQSIHDQSIRDPSIKSDIRRLNMKNSFFKKRFKNACMPDGNFIKRGSV